MYAFVHSQMCVCLDTGGYVRVYVPVKLCLVVLWPGSHELMRALLSLRFNSSIIHKTLCQQHRRVYVCIVYVCFLILCILCFKVIL